MKKFTLREYLAKKRLRPEDFAALAEVDRATIYRLLQGNSPSWRTAQAIQRASNNRIDMGSLGR